jgi:glutathione S-transferase
MLFEEKKIPYKIAKINMRSYGDKPDWFLKKIPSGLLPVVEIDGQIITESLDIMQILDKMYVDHGPQMVPIEGPERELAVQHLKLERKLFSDWCGLVFRPSGLFGMGDSSKKSFVKTLTTVDQELGSRPGPWFLGGDDPSLVDLQYISHVERMLASALYWKGLRIRNSGEFPNIDRWLDAFELRPSYQATKSDYYTHVRDIPPQYGDGYFDVGPEVTMARETIEGGCWRLPLSVDEDSLEPLTAPFNAGEEAARLEAAFKLVNNHLAVAEFAARGCGEPGKKRFQAPLADPYATPNEKYVPEVDALLRKLVQTLVDDNAIDTFRHGPPVLVEGALSRDATDLITCLKYLRDRVGVPRDMGFHAALQLRSHLNEIIFALGGNA